MKTTYSALDREIHRKSPRYRNRQLLASFHVNRGAQEPCALGDGPLEAYRRHVVAVPTPNVRGSASAVAERAQAAALEAGPCDVSKLTLARKVCLAAHCAYDAPKKFAAKAVLELRRRYLAQGGVSMKDVRASKRASETLKACVPAVRRYRTWAAPGKDLSGREFDPTELVAGTLGRVWMPAEKVRLGMHAGLVVRQLMLSHTLRPPFLSALQEERASRSPLLEVACLALHRLRAHREKEWRAQEVDDLVERLRSARRTPITSYRVLLESGLY